MVSTRSQRAEAAAAGNVDSEEVDKNPPTSPGKRGKPPVKQSAPPASADNGEPDHSHHDSGCSEKSLKDTKEGADDDDADDDDAISRSSQ
mmetsp:Transcript_32848/g.62758  ORF Transcript_32848/g.62758 Transcript_32848/m.62758 type:complete len:90 (-) Transcript_32848:408-677(-)